MATVDETPGYLELFAQGFEQDAVTYLSRDDAEEVVEGLASGRLVVPRDGTDLIVQVGSHPITVCRDRQRRGLTIQHATSGKVLARLKAPVCRWCAGDGIHPHLNDRKRQVLAVKRELYVAFEPKNDLGLSPMVTPSQKKTIEGPTQNNPFSRWWDQVTRLGCDLSMLPPREEMVCPRCEGDGF